MHQLNTKSLIRRVVPAAAAVFGSLLVATAQAAAPGITGVAVTNGVTFNLTAQTASLNQPDGHTLYSWGYGCNGAVGTAFGAFVGVTNNANCPTMQVPGPTLVVTEGQTVTVTLTNNLPAAAGNTSILFPGFQVIPSGGVAGLLTQEATPGGTVTYTFVASSPGTRSYYSGTQGDLQIEMGLYGAIIVVPSTTNANYPTNCDTGLPATNPGGNKMAQAHWGESDFRLAHAAYDHPDACYDREYLFQFAEADPNIHKAAQAQIAAITNGSCAAGGVCTLQVPTEPYHPSYFMINGRSMPDDMDPNYDSPYPNQPYNGNPHMHPGEQVLLRIIGQGRWQHPFHEHANHVRILARDGNMVLSNNNVNYPTGPSTTASAPALAGNLLFTTTTTPGLAMDGIFYFTGRGLNWDMYGHNPTSGDPLATLACDPDVNGYNTTHPTAVNYFEWCQDHYKPVEVNPFGDVPSGGPATLPNPNIFTNGAWYGGSPYFGPDATLRSDTTLRNDAGAGVTSALSTGAGNSASTGLSGCVTGQTIPTTNPTTTPSGVPAAGPTPNCTNLLPSNTQANPANERGWAFMWHSHNEREITTNNVFPGGMFMMMLVDSREFVIDESN